MKTIPSFHRVMRGMALLLAFTFGPSLLAAEKTAVTAGPPGAQAAIGIDVTDNPTVVLDWWDVWGEAESRMFSITERHMGYTDLKHSQLNSRYGVPTDGQPARYYRKQTISNTWDIDLFYYTAQTNHGSMSLTGQVNAVGETEFGPGSMTMVSTNRWMDIQGYNMYGPFGPEYIETTTLTGMVRLNQHPQYRLPIFDGTQVYNDGRPGAVDENGTFSDARPAPYWGMYGVGWAYLGGEPAYQSMNTGSPFATPPYEWTPTKASWDSIGAGGIGAINSAAFSYSIELSDEDTLAHVEARLASARAAGALENIPWGREYRIRYGGAEIEDRSSWDGSSMWLYNYHSDFATYGEAYEENAQVRVVVPEELRIPGVTYRARFVQYFYDDFDPTYTAQFKKLFEIELKEGHWESDPITPVIPEGDGFTIIEYFSMVTELVNPHPILPQTPSANPGADTAPAEYATTRPNIIPQDVAGGNSSRDVLDGSSTLQQIHLSDSWGAAYNWPDATATWSLVPGATANVRLWRWTNDGSALGVWSQVSQTENLFQYFGSGSDYFFVEALSAGRASVRISINIDGETVKDDIDVRTATAELAVDANRDGSIKFAGEDVSDITTISAPFKFWLNDDIDVLLGNGPASAADANPYAGTRNWDDGVINGLRDLEDFARLKLNLVGFETAVASGQIKVGLKWKNPDAHTPAIKLWRNLSPEGGREYLTDANKGQEHLALRLPGLVKDGMTYVIPTEYWTDVGLSSGQPHGNLLFEACSPGKGQLMVVLLKPDGFEIREGASVWLDLKPFNELYEHWTCGDTDLRGAAIALNAEHAYGTPFEYGPEKDGLAVPGAATYDDYVLFVHGWRMQPWERRAFAETAFKRMYHQGYKGRFGLFSWPTEWVDLDSAFPVTAKNALSDPQHYDRSEVVARKSGAGPLQRLLVKLNGKFGSRRLHVFAHSMGNVAVSEALRMRGPNTPLINTYIACQSADVGHAYDQSAASNGNSVNITDLYRYNPPNPRTTAAQRTEGDNYYKGLASRAHNRFLSFANLNDQALGKWDLNQYMKPDDGWLPSDTAFTYITSMGGLFDIYRANPPGTTGGNQEYDLFWPLDRFTILAHMIPARSRAAGATPGLAGEFDPTAELNLDGEGFLFGGGDYSHSAEFLSNFADRRAFYFRLLLAFDLQPDLLPAP